jgi:hypothetical protein
LKCEDEVDEHAITFETSCGGKKTLIINMVVDNGLVEATKANLVRLCDIDSILGLPCVIAQSFSMF